MAATDPLVPGARARALREYVSVPESTNIARLRAFAADMWIALVRRNEIASEKAMEKPGDCKFFSGNTTGVSLEPALRAHTEEAHTANVPADRVGDVRNEYATADERLLLGVRLERRA